MSEITMVHRTPEVVARKVKGVMKDVLSKGGVTLVSTGTSERPMDASRFDTRAKGGAMVLAFLGRASQADQLSNEANTIRNAVKAQVDKLGIKHDDDEYKLAFLDRGKTTVKVTGKVVGTIAI